MEFGRLTTAQLEIADLTLPPDGQQTGTVLKQQKRLRKPEFYVGCAKWGRKEWVGLIYPPKTKEVNFLEAYLKHFNSIELNATFYGIPKAASIEKWKETAAAQGKDFLFCPKFSNIISHIRRLNNAGPETENFLSSITGLGKYLGPCFLQLSDNFGPKNFTILQNYLQALPEDLKVFVELRHKEWFNDHAARKEVFSMLSELKKGAVITDTSGRRDCLNMELTLPETFIRFVGNGRKHHQSDKDRIDAWTLRLKEWLDHGLQKVYFFLHQHDEADTPLIAKYTIEQFNRTLGSDLREIALIA